MQLIQVIQMFPFQQNFSFGAVHSADEKDLSADTNIIATAKYSITNLCKTSNCVAKACVRTTPGGLCAPTFGDKNITDRTAQLAQNASTNYTPSAEA